MFVVPPDLIYHERTRRNGQWSKNRQ